MTTSVRVKWSLWVDDYSNPFFFFFFFFISHAHYNLIDICTFIASMYSNEMDSFAIYWFFWVFQNTDQLFQTLQTVSNCPVLKPFIAWHGISPFQIAQPSLWALWTCPLPGSLPIRLPFPSTRGNYMTGQHQSTRAASSCFPHAHSFSVSITKQPWQFLFVWVDYTR